MTANTIFEVRDMTCGACVRHVGDALRIAGVSNVAVRLRDGLVEIQHDPGTVSVPALVAALDGAGYPARPHVGGQVTTRTGGCCCG